MRKIIITFLFFILITSCSNVDSKKFNLEVSLKGTNYKDFLLLHYNDRIDSVPIIEGKYTFVGQVKKPTEAYLSLNNLITTADRTFYIENKNIQLNISIEKKSIKEFDVFNLKIDTLIGTKTEQIRNDFLEFKSKYSTRKDWKSLLKTELEKLFKHNPDNEYMVSLFKETIRDSALSFAEYNELYFILKENQDEIPPILKKQIEYEIYPSRRILINDTITHFELLNDKGILFHTKELKNELTLIEFWASWCKPCRKEFPLIKEIYEKYNSKGFNIVGISIDTNENEWRKALLKDDLNWINLFDGESYTGKVANIYGVFSIPSNLLINKNGVVLKKNISTNDLNNYLEKSLY